MFKWEIEDFDKIKGALTDFAGLKFYRSYIRSGGLEGAGLYLSGTKKIYSNIESLRADFPEVKEFIARRLGTNEYVPCIIVYLGNEECPRLFRDSASNPFAADNIPCFICQSLGSFRNKTEVKTVVYESRREAEFAEIVRQIELLEAEIKAAKEYLEDPWKEYRRKVDDFKQKLEKSKAVTEFTIKKTAEDLKMLEKSLEERQKALEEKFKSGKG